MGTVNPGQAADAVIARLMAHSDISTPPGAAEGRVLPSLILAELGAGDHLFDLVAGLWDVQLRLAVAETIVQARALSLAQ